jgi:hypothetical protein
MLGREAATLVNEFMGAGNYSVVFYADDLPSGIYLYMLSAGKQVITRKMILLR